MFDYRIVVLALALSIAPIAGAQSLEDTAAYTAGKVSAIQQYKIKELERKVAGMQKKITELCARVEKLEKTNGRKNPDQQQ